MLRRFVFPALRIIIWAVIAVALVKLAFVGAATTTDALQPTGTVTEPTVEVATLNITNNVSITAAVVADAPAPVKATGAGTIAKLLVSNGATVQAGAPLAQIRQETPQDPITKTDPETGETTVTERAPKVTTVTVTAAITGAVTYSALVEQSVSVGDDIASINPGTMSVTGQLSPEQQYRLVNAPAEAQASLNGGPAPFACAGLKVSTVAAGEESSGSGQITCAVPAGVVAFPGLAATISVVNGSAEGPAVPTTAVEGSFQTGNVWVLTEDGEPEKRAVTLGLTDGSMILVTEGLTVGEQVLEFAPTATPALDCSAPDAWQSPDYAELCG